MPDKVDEFPSVFIIETAASPRWHSTEPNSVLDRVVELAIYLCLSFCLKRSARDRQNLIFWLMNASLVLNIVSYVLLITTRELYFVIGLELSYLLMPAWAVLLARQPGGFTTPSQPDRTFKSVRAAYVWLIISCGMMPFFPLYAPHEPGVRAHLYGFTSARLHRGLYQHDDLGVSYGRSPSWPVSTPSE